MHFIIIITFMTKFERYKPVALNILIIFGGGTLLHILIQFLNRRVLNISEREDWEALMGFEWAWPVFVFGGFIYIALFQVWPDWRKRKKDREAMKG